MHGIYAQNKLCTSASMCVSLYFSICELVLHVSHWYLTSILWTEVTTVKLEHYCIGWPYCLEFLRTKIETLCYVADIIFVLIRTKSVLIWYFDIVEWQLQRIVNLNIVNEEVGPALRDAACDHISCLVCFYSVMFQCS